MSNMAHGLLRIASEDQGGERIKVFITYLLMFITLMLYYITFLFYYFLSGNYVSLFFSSLITSLITNYRL